MTEPRWKKGEWDVLLDDTGGEFTGWPSIWCEDADVSIVHRAGFKHHYWGDMSQRDAIVHAHLLATAPKLYAALARCCDVLEEICTRERWTQSEAERLGREALKEARGDT